MNVTPIYQLGYFIPNMIIGNDIDLDKNRFTTIENQLYNVYNIFGNGILSTTDQNGVQTASWLLSAIPNQQAVQISTGKGHIAYKYAETASTVDLSLALPGGQTTGSFVFYFYAIETSTTPVDKSVDFVYSLNQIDDPVNYIGLGGVSLVVADDGTYTLTVYNDADHGRQDISLFSSLTTLVKNHVHTGGTNNPSPIDLGKHVTGFLSSDHIDQLDLNKVTSGTLNPSRLPEIDHNSLTNIGTLTHAQIDSLLASLQYPDDNYSISDYGIVNRLQIILALKKQTDFFNIDGEQLNSIFYLPYTQLQGFVDTTNTTATVDTSVHRVYGVTGIARQSNVIKINSTQDFKTALFYAQDSITSPPIENIEVTGITTTSLPGTLNNPYGLTGSATTIYVSGAQDSFVSAFSTTGVFINRRIDFDANLNLNSPLGLWYDQTTNYLYIADTFNHRIVVTDGSLSNVIALLGYNGGTGLPGAGSGSGFNYPKGVYGFGNTFYVADSGNNQIQKYMWSGLIPNYQNTYQYSDKTITGINQALSDPRGIIATTFNSQNFLFIADYANHRVLCGVETSNALSQSIYSIFETLGGNSAGFGISNTSLVTYSPYSGVSGIGATFKFSNTLNGTISSISVSSIGSGYIDNDYFTLSYPGNQSGFFKVLTDGAGHITTAFVTYGFSTNNVRGFNHPIGLAFSAKSARMDLLISDKENDRIINYHAFSSVGLGTTNNQFAYTYNFGTTGSASDTSSIIYFNRPAEIYAQSGFTTVFVADSLNNRIHSLTTSYASDSVIGFSTYSFGVGDTALTSGGITLIKPDSYLGLALPFDSGFTPLGWYVGEIISQGIQYQSDSVERYNYFLFSASQILELQDTIAVAFQSINEGTGKTLGQVDCYLIFGSNLSNEFGIGERKDLTISSNSIIDAIYISNLVTIRESTSTLALIDSFFDLSLFTDQPQPTIIGFGFKWSTDNGWTNSDVFRLGWQLPNFDFSTLNTLYPKTALYRQNFGLTESVFAFNANTYAQQGTFIFRYDSGPGGQASFDNAIFSFSEPFSTLGQANIDFSYRYDDTLDELNTNQNFITLLPLSGGDVNIGVSGRYIDLRFDLSSSVDKYAVPVLSSLALYFSVYGQTTGIIYDTNVNNAPQYTYPRFKWSQGELSNIDIIPVPADNTQAYEIQIKNTANIGDYIYLSPSNLKLSDTASSSLVDSNNGLYLSPFQAFASFSAGLLNAQHYYSNGDSGYFIADTGNDRVLEVDSNGQLIRAIQGNITLPRCDRDFVILGVYYNTNTRQLYATFSQYLSLPLNYTGSLSVYLNGTTYPLTNSAYFDQVNVGLYKVNTNNVSATFYVNVTAAMDLILTEYPTAARFQVQNPTTGAPFNVPSTGRSDGNDPENDTVTYATTQFNEFIVNGSLGVGTILNYQSDVTVTTVDPVDFGSNTIHPSTLLWSYWQGAIQQPNYSVFYSIPIQVFPIYFDNIFKPLHVDFTDTSELVVSTVGNNSVRAYNSDFESSYTLNLSTFNFNEKLGGSTVVLDRGVDEPGNILLIAEPSNGLSTIIGNVYIYNRNTNSIINNYAYKNYDAVKAFPVDNSYLILLFDRPGNGLRSKLLRIGQDGTTNYALTNTFTKPVSLDIRENDKYYVTDTTGQYGTLYFRTFIADAGGNTTGAGNTGGGGGGGLNGGGTTGGTGGGGGVGGGLGG